MYRLRRTALETPSLKRNQTWLLPTAVPMSCSTVSFSEASVGTIQWVLGHSWPPTTPGHPTHLCLGLQLS